MDAVQHFLYIITARPDFQQLVEQVKDWCSDIEAEVLCARLTDKAVQGLIVMRWKGQLPLPFLAFLQKDEDVVDLFALTWNIRKVNDGPTLEDGN